MEKIHSSTFWTPNHSHLFPTSGRASWMCDLWRCISSHTQKTSELGLMLCFCHLGNCNCFETSPTFSFCSGHLKVESQCYRLHTSCGICSLLPCAPDRPASFPPPGPTVDCLFPPLVTAQLILPCPSISTHINLLERLFPELFT